MGLEVLATQVAAEAERLFPHGRKFDLVGFSMGGIVSRYYLQRLGGKDRVTRFITISAPHHGTFWARFASGAGCRQLAPQSEFLRELNRDTAELSRLRMTSLWTPLDLIILPAQSSELPQAQNIRVPVPIHPLMVRNTCVLRAVAAALSR